MIVQASKLEYIIVYSNLDYIKHISCQSISHAHNKYSTNYSAGLKICKYVIAVNNNNNNNNIIIIIFIIIIIIIIILLSINN